MPVGQLQLTLEPQRHVYAVYELNAVVARIFERDFTSIFVAGEISGCRQAASGHYYFSLKDEQSQLKCALFKGSARLARFKPQEGLAVIARGSLQVYEPRGEYQFIVESLEPQGAGALQLAFEQLKQKLAAEGLFSPERKHKLPRLPCRIAIITSPSGAVIRDILHVLDRRFRGLHIRLFPAQVQGDGAVDQVCAALRYFTINKWADVLILARGGGSLEDLWTFNEEAVARAIANCTVPVISAIGHETDFTIADFVADHRAPTPSAAAEIVICTSASLGEQISGCRSKLIQALRYRLLRAGRDLQQRGIERAERLLHRKISTAAQFQDDLEVSLKNVVDSVLSDRRRRLTDCQERLKNSGLDLRFARARHRAEMLRERLIQADHKLLWNLRARALRLETHLKQLSPIAVLERGYAIVERQNGAIVHSSEEAAAGEILHVRLHRGEIDVEVV